MNSDKKRIDMNLRCPSCSGPLYPRLLVCEACGLKVEGDFVVNEFGELTPDELHFLRVFINCEGRIKDMEAALGVSYPTVKAQLASIKGKLRAPGPHLGRAKTAEEPSEPGAAPAGDLGSSTGQAGPSATALSSEEILERLDNGTMTYKEAVRLLRARKKGDLHGDQD